MAPDDSIEDLRARHEQLLAERDDCYSGTARRGEIAGWVARRLEMTVFAGGALEECDEESDRGLVEIWTDLVELYCEFDERFSDDSEYQTRIVSLLTAFEYPIPTQIVTRVVDCSKGHARRFYWDNDRQCVREKEWSLAQRKRQATPKQVKHVLERDGHRCARCGAEEPLIVHHIWPVSQGGTPDVENLVTLCKPCHRAAHDEVMYRGRVHYQSEEGFLAWLASTD